jgi:hypothetical protein
MDTKHDQKLGPDAKYNQMEFKDDYDFINTIPPAPSPPTPAASIPVHPPPLSIPPATVAVPLLPIAVPEPVKSGGVIIEEVPPIAKEAPKKEEAPKIEDDQSLIPVEMAHEMIPQQNGPTEKDYYALTTELALAKQKILMEKEMGDAKAKHQQELLKMKEELTKQMHEMQVKSLEAKIQTAEAIGALKIEKALSEQARDFAQKDLAAAKKKIPVKREAWFCVKCSREKKLKECATCKDSPDCVEWMPISVDQ